MKSYQPFKPWTNSQIIFYSTLAAIQKKVKTVTKRSKTQKMIRKINPIWQPATARKEIRENAKESEIHKIAKYQTTKPQFI